VYVSLSDDSSHGIYVYAASVDNAIYFLLYIVAAPIFKPGWEVSPG